MTLADLLFNDHRYSAMLGITKDIFKYNLNDDEMQKIHYINGNANYELNNRADAMEEFNKCISINKDSAFGSLCNEAIELMDN